ncbi:MAG: hypothetical protein Q8W44_07335 [Candidatus Palauibacterales bacterium]|nr:hypothetical protein [Candidatus Palauibacterales bacterium]
MSRLRTILDLALGDFRERARRYSFLLTLGAAAYLAYTVHAGWWLVRIGEYAPASGPVRLGMLVAQATGIILSLVGFYVVKGSVERDQRTGVGQILAATPAGTRLQYTAAKFVSNTAVLGAMLLVLGALAVAMAWWRSGVSAAAIWQIGAPTLLIAAPTLVLVAGLAVLFDSVPWLRGAAGNVLYFFVWSGLIGASVAGSPALDLTGYALIHDSLREALAAARPDVSASGLTVQLRPGGLPDVTRFEWAGVSWSPGAVAWRLYWVAAGTGLAGLAALFLHLFDPFGDRSGSREEDAEENGAEAGDPDEEAAASTGTAAADAGTTARGDGTARSPAGGFSASGLPSPRAASAVRAFLRTAGGELRLLVSGHAWWWYGLVAAASVAAFLLPSGTPPQTVLLAAWLLPVSAWSSLGCRERQHGTEQMLFSAPGPRLRQLPAQLAAGAGLALLTAAGPVVALFLSGDLVSLAALGAGAVFVPALALCLGAWSGSTRPFEALYVVLWYIGPVNGVPFLDFMGVSGQAVEVGASGWFTLSAAALALLAWPGRQRQMSAVG